MHPGRRLILVHDQAIGFVQEWLFLRSCWAINRVMTVVMTRWMTVLELVMGMDATRI